MLLRHLRMTLIVLGMLTPIQEQNVSRIERISSLLERVCPGVDVCLSNSGVQQSPESNGRSCCTGCSCEDTCHLSMNCCFPELTEYDVIPDAMKSPKFDHVSCIYTFTTIPSEDVKLNINSYRMISSEDDAGPAETCGNQKVALWGSLFPVYSKQKDLIFKNSACAKAYNVEDGILWQAFLICTQFAGNTGTVNSGATFTITPGAIIPDDCYVYFQYPEDEIESHVCYIADDFISTCPTSEFSVPRDLNLDKDDILTSCTSGLVSPYKYREMYANVFCFICNERSFSGNNVCLRNDIIVHNTNSLDVGFIGLLNMNNLLPDERAMAKRIIRVACLRSCNKVNSDVCCREILCPSGQSRDHDGNCYFPTDIWYITEYEVMVNLSAPHDMDMKQLFAGRNNALKPTWPEHWYVNQVSREIKDNGNLSTNILVSVKVPSARVSPNVLILNIQSIMRRQWGIIVDDQLIPMYSSFSDMSSSRTFLSKPILNETIITISPNVTKVLPLPLIKRVYKNGRYPVRIVPFYITRLYYCEQVELLESEYVLYDDWMYKKKLDV